MRGYNKKIFLLIIKYFIINFIIDYKKIFNILFLIFDFNFYNIIFGRI